MQVIVYGRLVGADCSAPCRMAFPPQELLWFFGFESIDIGFPLRDDSKGLPYKFVGDSNDRNLAWLAIRPQTVETCLALGVAPKWWECRHIELASEAWIPVPVDVTFDIDWRTGLLISRRQAQVTGKLLGVIKVGKPTGGYDERGCQR